MVGPANCFATRYGGSRIQSGTMQLGLRFAAAKLPGLRTGRGAASFVEPSGTLVARGGDRASELCYHQPAVPLYDKQRQHGGAIAIYASRKSWFGQPRAAPDGWARAHPRGELTSVGRHVRKAVLHRTFVESRR